MPKYRVYGAVTGSKYLGEYEADSPEEAEEMALNKEGHVCFCHQCSDQCEDPEVTDINVEVIKESE